MYWNVRSLINKIDSIRQEIYNIQPDVLNICESWLHKNIDDSEVYINGYNLVRYDRGNNPDGSIKKGGGLCTFVKQGIIFENLTDLHHCDVNIEMNIIKLKLPFTRDIFVVNTYRPPAGDVDMFIRTLQKNIENIRDNSNIEIFIGGDMNIDLLRPNTINSRKFLKFIKINQFKQLIKTITRPDSNTCLDLMITNCDIIKEQGTCNINISDHLPIFCVRKKGKTHKVNTDFNGRSYKGLNEDRLTDLLNDYDWEEIAGLNVDDGWNVMYTRIMNVVDTLCPIKTFKFSRDKPNWLKNDIILLMKERDRCLRKYSKTHLETDKTNMRKIRNLVNISVKNARADYIKEKLETHKNDPKKFWKHISEILPNKKSNSQQINNIHDDNNDIIGHDQLADHINCYFSSIGLKHIPRHQHEAQQLQPNVNIPASIDRFKSIKEDELLKELEKNPIFKSSGLPNMPTYLLKLCFLVLINQLLIIMNKSLFNGYFPKNWLKAIVVPIPKINIPLEIGDLRPIALTPLPGKILERFVHTQLLSHLDQYNILTEYQNGFRKNRSTIDTIFRYTTDLQLNKNNKYSTISLYVDFKKALIL